MLEVSAKKNLSQFSLDVSFAAGNELLAIFGPSGSGKSLTLQCIAGLLRPDAGRITINGRAVFDSSIGIDVRPQGRRVGYVFQSYALLPHLTAAENISYGLHRLPREDREERTAKVIEAMRLQGLDGLRPGQLSGGQQQRVALARALVTDPELLLLDEPFSALDSPIRGRLHNELLRLLERLPITTVLVTHNLEEAYTLSRTMAVIDGGRVLQIGPREEILRHPASRTVARFTATKNLFRGEVLQSTPSHLEVRSGSMVVRTPPGVYEPGDVVDFCIRPEEIMLIRPGEAAGQAVGENQFAGEVVREVARGTSYTLMFRLAGDPLGTGREYDLHIEIPAHVYHRLDVPSRRNWTVSLKRGAIHVIGRTGEEPGASRPAP